MTDDHKSEFSLIWFSECDVSNSFPVNLLIVTVQIAEKAKLS